MPYDANGVPSEAELIMYVCSGGRPTLPGYMIAPGQSYSNSLLWKLVQASWCPHPVGRPPAKCIQAALLQLEMYDPDFGYVRYRPLGERPHPVAPVHEVGGMMTPMAAAATHAVMSLSSHLRQRTSSTRTIPDTRPKVFEELRPTGREALAQCA